MGGIWEHRLRTRWSDNWSLSTVRPSHMFPIDLLISGLVVVGVAIMITQIVLIVLAWRVDVRARQLLEATQKLTTKVERHSVD